MAYAMAGWTHRLGTIHRIGCRQGIQSPNMHRASGSAQIAPTTLLRLHVQAKGSLSAPSIVDAALEIWQQPTSLTASICESQPG